VTAALFPEGGSAKVGRLVLGVLKADALLPKVFGEEIFASDYPVPEHPIVRGLALRAIVGVPKRTRVPGGDLVLAIPVQVTAHFPRTTPATSAIATPPAPTVEAVGAPGSGALTGTFVYRHTRIEGQPWSAAESYASPGTTITLDRQGALVKPGGSTTGALGLRVWRSPVGLVSCRWAGTALPAGDYTDASPDARLGDELAPDLFLERNLQEYLSRILYASETLEESGTPNADAALDVQFGPDALDPATNLRTVSVIAWYPSLQDAETGDIVVSRTP